MIAARTGLLVVVVAASFALACDASSGAASNAASHEDRGGNCASCHMPDYRHADNPVHVDVKPATCAVCHSQDSWRPSVVHHEWWPLVGAHQKAECSFCHKGSPPVFKGTSKDCVSCHRQDYDSSTFPGHSTFPTKCADCHTTIAFRPATHKPPPPSSTTAAPTASFGTLAPLGSKSHPTTRPAGPGPVSPLGQPQPQPQPPRVPTTRPPPDVTSQPSPRRR